jgi:hypothetical protein
MAWRISLFVVCALLLGAHYLREGNLVLVVLCLCTPLLFLLRKRWLLTLLQVLAYGAAVAWIDVGVRLVLFRQQIGRPWLVAALFPGSVAIATLLCGALLNSHAIKMRYPR